MVSEPAPQPENDASGETPDAPQDSGDAAGEGEITGGSAGAGDGEAGGEPSAQPEEPFWQVEEISQNTTAEDDVFEEDDEVASDDVLLSGENNENDVETIEEENPVDNADSGGEDEPEGGSGNSSDSGNENSDDSDEPSGISGGNENTPVDESDKSIETGNGGGAGAADDSMGEPETPGESGEADLPAKEQGEQEEREDGQSEREDETVVYEAENTVFNSDYKYMFSDKECVIVKSGEYYCVSSKNENGEEKTAGEDSYGKASVVAEVDSAGDKEIYLLEDGRKKKITDNFVTDDMPYYDEGRGVVVWQSEEAGRFQIMAYDKTTGITTRLTNFNFNNTNPHMDNNIAVWQGWNGDDWDVFYYDFSSPEKGARVITDNSYNDMFPKANRFLIVWQANINGVWRVFMHNLETGETEDISGGGGSFESPRFVVMMDSRKENGDIERYTYDVSTGETESVATVPDKKTSEVPPLEIPTKDPVSDQNGAVPSSGATTTPVSGQGQKDEGEGGEVGTQDENN